MSVCEWTCGGTVCFVDCHVELLCALWIENMEVLCVLGNG